jgi:hypothetical protein
MSAAYFKAAIPEPFRILGLALKPISLGRYRLLKRFDCAFVSEGERTAKAEDLIVGVLICSMRCDEFLAWLDSRSFQKDIAAWSHQVSPWPLLGRMPWLGKWWRERNSFDLLEKIILFKRYIEASSQTPVYFDESDGLMTSAAHWSHGLEVTLRSELGWGTEEINEEPLSKARADYFKFLENKGMIRLMTDEEAKEGEANAAAIARAVARGA